ncbi:MAG: hypothetical protein ACOY42_08930 [Pseudomonadota bacterium]
MMDATAACLRTIVYNKWGESGAQTAPSQRPQPLQRPDPNNFQAVGDGTGDGTHLEFQLVCKQSET